MSDVAFFSPERFFTDDLFMRCASTQVMYGAPAWQYHAVLTFVFGDIPMDGRRGAREDE